MIVKHWEVESEESMKAEGMRRCGKGKRDRKKEIEERKRV